MVHAREPQPGTELLRRWNRDPPETGQQERYCRRAVGISRFVHNLCVATHSWPRYQTHRQLAQPQHKAGPPRFHRKRLAATGSFRAAAQGWGEYRRKVKSGQHSGRRVSFLKFNRRRHEQGFRADNGPDTVKVNGKAVILPKIGRVAMTEQLRFHGSIREVCINRTAGTRFARFFVEDGQEP